MGDHWECTGKKARELKGERLTEGVVKKLVGTKKSWSMMMMMSMTIHKSNMALPKFNGDEDKSAKKKTTTNEPLKFTKSGVGLAKRSSNIPCVIRNKSREYLA